MLKGIVIHLVVVAIKQQVFACTGALKQVLRPAAKAGTAGHIDLGSAAGNLKSFDNDISSRACDFDTRRSIDLRPSRRLCCNGDGLCRRTLLINSNIRRCGIYAVGKDDDIAR